MCPGSGLRSACVTSPPVEVTFLGDYIEKRRLVRHHDSVCQQDRKTEKSGPFPPSLSI